MKMRTALLLIVVTILLVLVSTVLFIAAIWATSPAAEDNYAGTGGVLIALSVITGLTVAALTG